MSDAHDLFGNAFGVALATPFTRGGALDEAALASLVRHVVAGGADFVVALGSTGEASMLDDSERARVLEVVEAERGAATLVVGTTQAGTQATIAATRQARDAGAAAVLVAVPPYTKPTQAGIVAHFRAITAAVPDMPVIAYNVPSRCGVNMSAATAAELWQFPSIVAIKESSGDLTQIGRIAHHVPPGRMLLAGDDPLLLPIIAVGGHGIVSVVGNVAPEAMRDLLAAARSGDLALAQAHHHALMPLFDALGLEANPIPIKAALGLAGIADPTPRLPLLPASEPTRAAIKAALNQTKTTADA